MKTFTPRMQSASSQRGFSLVELTIVVVILGVIAMMGVPRYNAAVERAKASEAYTYLSHVAKAQEVYLARHGVYADELDKLSVRVPDPQHFSVGALSSYDWQTRWNLRLTREGASSGYGAYSVSWNAQGFDAARSSIPATVSPSGQGGEQSVGRSTSGDSNGNNGVGNGEGGGQTGNRGNGGGAQGNNGRGPQGNNGVGNGEGGGRTGNRGRRNS